MPSFPSWDIPATSRLPPTPPEYNPPFGAQNGMMHDLPYYPTQKQYSARQGRNGTDFIEQFAPSSNFSSQAPLTTGQSQSAARLSRDLSQVASYVPQPAPQNMYGSIAASIVPPLRSHEPIEDPLPPQYMINDARAQPEQKQQEEKPVGGVAVHLDYEMDQMSDFVAEMAQGMYAIYTSRIALADIDFMRSVHPNSVVSPAFRRYVSQILSSTRLPSSTILLGLYYLATRMQMLSANGNHHKSPASIYRMLTIALLLGSKFLDDNTFQNRSWAEVSSIPVAELNTMELEWLFDFEWTIHRRIFDERDGFPVWRQHWMEYKKNAAAVAVAKARESHKLTPIDTGIRRSHSVNKALMSPEGPIPPQYRSTSTLEPQWMGSFPTEYSPPSAPHSGPTTPDFYGNGTWAYSRGHAPPPYSRQMWASTAAAAYIPPRSQPPSYHHTPSYNQQYAAPSVWTGHGSSCACSGCRQYERPYFVNTLPYGVQPVAG